MSRAIQTPAITPALAANTPHGLCGGLWRVLSNEFAPEIKRGEHVLLSAEHEPAPGDIVAVPAQNEHGFRLARHTPGGEFLAVVAVVSMRGFFRLSEQEGA